MSTNNAVEQKNTPIPSVVQRFGWELKGDIWKDEDGKISISVPGGRNFGGCFTAAIKVEEVNGRKIAVSETYDDDGFERMKAFDGLVLTSYHRFLSNPTTGAFDTLQFGHGLSMPVRWAIKLKNNASGKGPVASYYLSL